MLRAAASLALVTLLAGSCVPKLLPCSVSYPEAVPVEALTRLDVGEVLQPQYVVLHRCFAGDRACGTGKECKPMGIYEIPLVFRSSSVGFRTILAENHTACGCFDAGVVNTS